MLSKLKRPRLIGRVFFPGWGEMASTAVVPRFLAAMIVALVAPWIDGSAYVHRCADVDLRSASVLRVPRCRSRWRVVPAMMRPSAVVPLRRSCGRRSSRVRLAVHLPFDHHDARWRWGRRVDRIVRRWRVRVHQPRLADRAHGAPGGAVQGQKSKKYDLPSHCRHLRCSCLWYLFNIIRRK